ncbi:MULTISPECIES: DUF429 domain-containing protein [Methylomonas]|uniref:DUF429 domain-containing protein n=1 Tax=Methylomonas TaxID=416 RepID=UPI0009ED553D|nr:DUF429 domain-containing protein [Methylomonas koyamae]
MKYIGIDGCKSGWLYVGLDDDLNWTIDIMANISELSALSRNSTLILIDIPIGLREAGRIERLCDLEARKNLEGRRSSVFPAPSRPALNGPTYRECSQINFEITGRKLSQQSYAIAPKIKEVDDYLATLDLRGKIREIHPEVCFWALNNYTPMRYRKKSPEGEMERIDLLKKHLDCTNHIIEKIKIEIS